METRDQAGGYLYAVYPDDAEQIYVKAPQYLDKILENNPELKPLSPNGRPAKYFRIRRGLYGGQLSCLLFYKMFQEFMIGQQNACLLLSLCHLQVLCMMQSSPL